MVRSSYKRFLTDTGGQVAVTFALVAVPLVALTSAGIDHMRYTSQKQDIKGALDAAVIAAVNNNAIALDDKPDFAEAHFLSNYDGKIDLKLSSEVEANRVRLSAEGVMELEFGQLIGIGNPYIKSSSTGQMATETTICVLALSETANDAIVFDYDLNFVAPNCSVHSNSNSKVAIVAENPLNLPAARSFCAVGGSSGNFEPASKGECRAVEDPYETAPPAEETACVTEFWTETNLEDAPKDGEPMPTDTKKGRGKNPPSSGNSLSSSLIDTETGTSLPETNPVSFDDLMAKLIAIHGEDKFNGGGRNRQGDKPDRIADFHKLSGDKMREIIAAYTEYGKTPNCDNDDHKDHYECTAWEDTSLEGKQREELPSLWLLNDIFEISYGSFYPELDAIPPSLDNENVEEIEGKFYSRSNFDDALVHISSNLTGSRHRLKPGTYCGGLTVDGTEVTFMSGDYIMKDGPLTFLNNSRSTAKGVTFGFVGRNATLNIETGSTLDISAPMTGPRAGLAFMEHVDPDVPGNRERSVLKSRIASGGQLKMAGTAYLPTQALQVTGDESKLGSRSAALGLIADTLEFAGERGSRVEIDVNHREAGVPPIQPRAEDGARLVE